MNHDPSRYSGPMPETSAAERDPFSLYGFEVTAPGGIEEVYFKLTMLQWALYEGQPVRVCMDFDHTLTSQNTGQTWVASAKTLRGDLVQQSEEERNFFLALQRKGLLTDAMEAEWSRNELTRLMLNGEADEELSRATASIALATGVPRLFSTMNRYQGSQGFLPIIVSGGVGNVIETILNQHHINLPSSQVIANRYLPHIPGENMVFPELKDIIGSLNKPAYIEARFPSAIDESQCTIALGDSPTDAAMAFGGLSIRVSQPGGNDMDYIDESRVAGFDLVLRADNLLVVSELLEQVADVLYGNENH